MQITEDRRKRVIDLYFNQHKTYAEIAEIEHISPRDIHAIIKGEETRRQKYEHQQQEEISSKAYELYSNGKKPVEVAIVLNLREPEATKLYTEYWKLKRLHILTFIYKETNGNLGPFLKLYRQLIKEKGMSTEQIVNSVDIAANKLPYMEGLYKQLKDEVDKMQRTRQETENNLHTLNDEIASSKELLQSYHISCQRKRQEAEKLNNEISRLETLVSRFKNSDEEYLEIQKMVEEEVSKFLADGKVLLQFALASVIEVIRRNPDKYNNLLVCNASSSSSAILIQQLPSWHIVGYKDMILDESKELYEKLLKHFTNSILDNTVSK